jgi:outer membrane protein TolC
MRRVLAVSAIGVFLLSAGLGQSQIAKLPPTKLTVVEELQAEALKNNPDIMVELAKLRLAEARVERVRTIVKLRVAWAHAEHEAARAEFAEGQDRYGRALKLFEKHAIAQEDLSSARLTMAKLRGEMIAKEMQLNLLLARSPNSKAPIQKPRDK